MALKAGKDTHCLHLKAISNNWNGWTLPATTTEHSFLHGKIKALFSNALACTGLCEIKMSRYSSTSR